MDIITAIQTRRSVRAYTEEPVSGEALNTLLEAAMAAPSAGNGQPWQFVVIEDRDLLAKAATIHPYVGMAKNAPLAVLVCGDARLEKYPGYWPQDCAAATQNLLLAATGLGLGAVWTGIYPVEERMSACVSLFSLPEPVMPFSLVIVGHPKKQEGKNASRFNPERVHRNRWG